MDTRYQVFISSTFIDLKDERQAVLKAILELDQMPAGMELFPAADDSAWQLISDVIDASDYYVVIVGGRYGALSEDGLGYTEKEYDYAVQVKKPVIPLLHENPDNLPREKTEIDEASWKKLQTFRAKIEKRHTCVYWKSTEDLKAKVIVGLTAAMKRHPATGWVRADQVPTGATVTEVLALRNRVAELEAEAQVTRLTPPEGTDQLQHGEDTFEIHIKFTARNPNNYHREEYSGHITAAWNEIFAAIAPSLINEAANYDLNKAFRNYFRRRGEDVFAREEELVGMRLDDFKFQDDEIETCVVQFRALGLIRESIKQRSVKDTNTYWSLTPYGDYLMTKLRALRRKPLETGELRSGEASKHSEEITKHGSIDKIE